MDLIRQLEDELGKDHIPAVRPGDTVEVRYLIREGDKERTQPFRGTVIAIQGDGLKKAIVVRRIVQGEGVERTFPLHSPRVLDVVVQRRGRVRRAKLYYLRDRVGKGARVRELVGAKARRDKEADAAAREAAVAAAAAADEAAQAAAEQADETPDEAETVEA